MKLEIHNIKKRYGKKVVLEDVSLTLPNGLYGLLGANGAGKTTLLRIMTGILNSDDGTITCNDIDIKQMKEEYQSYIGYLPQNFTGYKSFTALEFLMFMSAAKGITQDVAKQRSLELLKLVGLEQEKNKKIRTFSGGMKQRLGIAQVFLNKPKIVLLDEPTSGLDPKERIRFRTLLSQFEQEAIILISTHIVTDLEDIADYIIMLKQGTVICEGDEPSVTKIADGKVWKVVTDKKYADKLSLTEMVVQHKNIGELAELKIIADHQPTEDAILVEPTLEDAYMYCFREVS